MTNKIALLPGSFDPLTLGHIDIIYRSLKLFEKIIIGIGDNKNKKHMYTLHKRKEFVKAVFANNKQIIIKEYKGLTTSFCEQEGVKHIIRGVRNHADFEYEQAIAQLNHKLNPNIETILLPTRAEHLCISSSLAKEIIIHNGDLTNILPTEIVEKIQQNTNN